MKNVLITGSSSGYGLETARHFHARGWNVFATMRTPDEEILPESDRMHVLRLDVTDPGSIEAALDAAGTIDVLVNNAGVGMIGALEGTSMETIRRVFETNTFGVIAVTRAAIPRMRERGAGTIVNVTSSVTLAPMPLVSVYAASKFAIEGFTGSLRFELEGLGLDAKLVEPGYCPTTSFAANLGVPIESTIPEPYAEFAGGVLGEFEGVGVVTTELDVAEGVFAAATDRTGRLRFPAGPDAVALAAA